MKEYKIKDKRGDIYIIKAENVDEAVEKLDRLVANDKVYSIRECLERGNHIWVPGYRKKDGTYVKGYCKQKSVL